MRRIDLQRRHALGTVGLAALTMPSAFSAGTVRAPVLPIEPMLPASQAEGYRLVFADEFDDTDLGRFNEDGMAGPGQAVAWRSRMRHPRKDIINQEKQVYVDRAYAGLADGPLGIEPFELDLGVLALRAQRVAPALQPLLHGQAWSSGCITSELSHTQQYGYFEMRARLPVGRGLWPAFWLLPVRATWPPEIDIMEGSGDRPGEYHFSVRNPGDSKGRNSGWRKAPVSASGWQVFGCEWTAERITFFVNGHQVWQLRGHDVHEPMYLVANLALGSHEASWIPDPDSSTPHPSRFEIDYVRAFSRL